MDRPLSLLMASDDFLPAGTGVGTHLKIMAPELVRRGHRVAIVTTRRKGQPSEEIWEGVRVFRVFSVPAYGFYQALPSGRTLRKIVDMVRPDVIHHHYVGYLMARLCRIAERAGIPQVSTYHFSSEVLTQPLLMRPFASLIRRLLVAYNNRFSLIIAPSRNLARQIASEGVRTPIRYISNPVVFAAAEVTEGEPGSPTLTILYAGRLGTEKNVPLLIRAVALLQEEGANMVLEIAGQGPEMNALRSLCSELEVTNCVKFLGFLDHASLAECYARCDVFVLPSIVETQGLVAMEAMRFAKPVIVTKVIVSAEELVTEGVNGFLVDPHDPEELASRLMALGADPEMRRAMGSQSAIRSNSYRPEIVVSETELAYREVLAGLARRPAAFDQGS